MERLKSNIIYGLRTDICQNVHYVKNDEILYPVGKSLAVHNFIKNRQMIIPLAERHQINIVDVSPNKKYAALCEYGEKPTISIYNLQTSKRMKTVGIPFETTEVSKFQCISFSFDNKNIAAVTDGPDQMMLFYNWEKGKVESSIKFGNTQNASVSVNHVACNPTDVGIAAVAGLHVFKFLTVSETQWRPYGFSKADNISICSIAWVNGERLFAGTRDGKILFLENGDLKNVFTMRNLDIINMKQREENAVQMATAPNVSSENGSSQDVYCITFFQKGVALAYGSGKVCVFQKIDNNKLKKSGTFVLPIMPSRSENRQLYDINHISIDSNGDEMVISSGWSQLFHTSLWKSNEKNEAEEQIVEILGQPLHHGGIKFMSTCGWKSIVVTYGEEDRILKIWNFQTESMILMKRFNDDLSCISLHPTGLFCFVGFVDKLKLMSILLEDLVPTRELPISNCKTTLFSRGGHLFAIVIENVIKIYATLSMNHKFNLKGHVKHIQAMEWSYDDNKLYSIGLEGAIYEWDIVSGNRTAEVILKNIMLKDIAVDTEVNVCYCVSDDHMIRKIENNEITHEANVENLNMSLIRIGKINKVIFLASTNGVIATLKLPLQKPLDLMTYNLHSCAITQMTVTYNEEVIVTADSSGTLCFWKFYNEDNIVTFEQPFYTVEILIGVSDLIEKNQFIKELSLSLKELKSNHEYDIRQIQKQHNDKLKEIHSTYHKIITELNNKINNCEEHLKTELSRMNLEILELKTNHEKVLRETTTDYEHKLKHEYEKYDEFVEKYREMQEKYESQLSDLNNVKATELQETIDTFTEIIQEKELEIKKRNDDLLREKEAHKSLIALIEDDTDREIIEIHSNYKKIINEEKQKYINLEGEVGAYRNKYNACQEENRSLKQEIDNLKNKLMSYQGAVDELKVHKQELLKSVKEGNMAIEKKEEQIAGLKKNNQQLEKLKVVLNYNIEELKKLVEKRDESIEELKRIISVSEVEKTKLYQMIDSLNVQLSRLQEKLKATRLDYQMQLKNNKKYKLLFKNVRNDLFNAIESIQNSNEFKKLVVKMYNLYNQDPEFLLARDADLETQNQLMKQNIRLRNLVDSLKKKSLRGAHLTTELEKKYQKQVDDNAILIQEVSDGMKKYTDLKKKMDNLEAILGLKSIKNLNVAKTRKKLDEIIKRFEESKELYNNAFKNQFTMEKTVNELNDRRKSI